MALYALRYNFVRITKALRVTPATAAGIVDWLWLTGTAKHHAIRLARSRGRSLLPPFGPIGCTRYTLGIVARRWLLPPLA